MKFIVAALMILFVLVMVGFGSSTSWKEDSYSTGDGLTEFKTKIADAMIKANHDVKSGFNATDEQKDDGLKANLSSINSTDGNASAINSSALNSSLNESSLLALEKDFNKTLINQSAENENKNVLSAKGVSNSKDAIPAGSTFSQNSAISPSGVHFNNQGSFNGIWSMEASKHGFGRNGVNDRIALSGNFSVQKSVSFKE